jgi:hypothetical protein
MGPRPLTPTPIPTTPISSSPIRRSCITSRDTRIAIQTALLFNVPYKEICKKLNVTEQQIWYTKNHRLTPQKNRAGWHPLLQTPQKRELETWILESPSHRRVAYENIPHFVPQLLPGGVGEKAIRTALKALGYVRRTSKKKGFSDDPVVMAERLAFAREGITWTPIRVQKQMFSDEVWATGGAHTVSYVTVKEDRSDRYHIENLTHKYSKKPAWMFHRTIVDGKKGPEIF